MTIISITILNFTNQINLRANYKKRFISESCFRNYDKKVLRAKFSAEISNLFVFLKAFSIPYLSDIKVLQSCGKSFRSKPSLRDIYLPSSGKFVAKQNIIFFKEIPARNMYLECAFYPP